MLGTMVLREHSMGFNPSQLSSCGQLDFIWGTLSAMSTSSPHPCWNRSRDEGKLVRKAVIILELLRDQQQDAKHTLQKLAFNKH